MATAPDPAEPLNLREQIARIDHILATAAQTRQETRYVPVTLAFTGVGAGAAIFAAGAAFAKLFVG